MQTPISDETRAAAEPTAGELLNWLQDNDPTAMRCAYLGARGVKAMRLLDAQRSTNEPDEKDGT